MTIRSLFFVIFFLLLNHESYSRENITEKVAEIESDKQDSAKVKFAGIPMISYDPSLGTSFGIMGMALYKVNPKDTISPSSSTGSYFAYTTNKSYFAVLFQSLYLNEDKYRINFGGGIVGINYQYYQNIPIEGMDGLFIDFNTKVKMFMLEAKRKTISNLYVGGRVLISHVTTVYDIDIPEVGNPTDARFMNALGLSLDYDHRDFIRYPTEGYIAAINIDFYREAIGGTNDFEKYIFTYNKYFNLKDKKHILLARVFTKMTSGDIPFQAQSVINRDDIRGYTNGKHRGNQLYTAQTEYRGTLYKRFGMVAFAGIASVSDNVSEAFKNTWYPGVGVGARFMLLPSEKINIGLDAAVGVDDWGIYLRLGDTFGR